MTRSAFLRARRPEHKQLRRDAILTAARGLARESGVRNVTLGAVAEAVGLAKSNISRYFGTREEIYLELLAEQWREYTEATVAALHDARDTEVAVNAIAETMVQRPLFCDLLSHLPTSLEQNVSATAARTFKYAVHDRGGIELLAAAGGRGGLLYRPANPPPVLAEVYAEDPKLAATRPEMMPT